MSLCLIFTISSAYNLILSCLTHLEIVNAGKICHHARDAVEGYQRAAFNINGRLAYYFDPLSFRDLQARTGTLLSGAVACRFLERSSFRPNRIELIVYAHHALEVAHWLLSVGYSAASQAQAGSRSPLPAPPVHGKGFERRLYVEFTKSNDSDHIPGTICTSAVIVIAPRSPIELLLETEATVFLNFITWEKAYSLFPRALLHDCRVLLLHDEDGGSSLSDEDQARVRGCGFEIIEFLDKDECRDMYRKWNSSFPLGWRRVNDSMSLSIQLNVSGIQAPLHSPNIDPLTATVNGSVDDVGFRLSYTPYDPSALACIKFDVVHSDSAYIRYPICDSELLYQLERALMAGQLGTSNEWSHWVLLGLLERDRMAMQCLE